MPPQLPRVQTGRRHPKAESPLSGGFLKADARIRTADPFITSEVLYQLSYVGAPRIVGAGRLLRRAMQTGSAQG